MLVRRADGDLHDVAIDDLAVHRIRRMREPYIDESGDLATELRDQRDARGVGRMLSAFTVKRGDRICLRNEETLWIEPSVMRRTLQERARQPVGVFRERWPNND